MESGDFVRKLILYVPVKLIPALTGICFVAFLYKELPAGQYVKYSMSILISLLAAQLSSGWLSNALLYYLPSSKNKNLLIVNSFIIVCSLAAVVSVAAAVISLLVLSDSALFGYVWCLCFAQSMFGLATSIHQSGFLIREQLVSVLLQCMFQISCVYVLFSYWDAEFEFAIAATAFGYALGGVYLYFSLANKYYQRALNINAEAIKRDFSTLFKYGAPLTPWMIGIMVMSGMDRFSIDSYSLFHGDAYLSVKDILVGASGLVSMPLLMLIHPLIVKEFVAGRFAHKLLQSAIALLTMVFSILWTLWQFVGMNVFQALTGKHVNIPIEIVFFIFVGVYFNCLAIYVQKRLEVHKRILLMAIFALLSGLIAVPLSFLGAKFFGLVGVSLAAVVAQGIYLLLVGQTLIKKINVWACFVIPLIFGGLYWGVGWITMRSLDVFLPEWGWMVKIVLWLCCLMIITPIMLWFAVSWKDFSTNRESVK